MNRKNRVNGWVAAACAVVLPFAAAAGDAPRVYTYQVQLDGKGALQSATPVDAGDDATSRQLQAELAKWIFVPSANATSSVTTWVRVNAIPATGDAPARALSANAGPAPDRLSKPTYPAHAQRKGYEGVVVLEVAVGADGAVSAARVHDTVGSIDRAMAESALAAARSWTFRQEVVDGVAQQGKLLMPVCFVASEDARSCEWKGPDKQHFGRHMVFAFDPAARLRSNPDSYAIN